MEKNNWERKYAIRVKVLIHKILTKLAQHTISKKRITCLHYNDPHRRDVIDLINSIKRDVEMVLSINEAYSIYMAVKNTRKIPGDAAEVGVYKGGSAKLICEAKEDKPLHLFDTFEGIPKISSIDSTNFYTGQYVACLGSVRNFLKIYSNVYFYKGVFPSTSDPVKDKQFSFVHLDVDTYESTFQCLEFFYPRMVRGGVIISHDYINSCGVRKAFDEFFEGKVEPVIELSGSQCLIEKINEI